MHAVTCATSHCTHWHASISYQLSSSSMRFSVGASKWDLGVRYSWASALRRGTSVVACKFATLCVMRHPAGLRTCDLSLSIFVRRGRPGLGFARAACARPGARAGVSRRVSSRQRSRGDFHTPMTVTHTHVHVPVLTSRRSAKSVVAARSPNSSDAASHTLRRAGEAPSTGGPNAAARRPRGRSLAT